MCLAFPGKIISINNHLAMVNFDGIKKEINISLTPDVKKGDYVIVHTGFAIQKMDKPIKIIGTRRGAFFKI